jgi:hypothetical protein
MFFMGHILLNARDRGDRGPISSIWCGLAGIAVAALANRVQIPDRVTALVIRQTIKRGHGVM